MDDEHTTSLPRPPEVARKFQSNRLQLVGVPLLMLIPVLALLGVFGESVSEVSASNAEFEMHVDYPTRFRYKMANPLEVSIRNVSSRPIPTLTITFDHSYISRFSEVQFTPQVKEVTGTSYVLELTNIQPGETRRVSVDLQGERYGRHHGDVTALSEGGSRAQVSVSTIIFP